MKAVPHLSKLQKCPVVDSLFQIDQHFSDISSLNSISQLTFIQSRSDLIVLIVLRHHIKMEFTGIEKPNIHLSDSSSTDSDNRHKLTLLPTESSGSETNEQEIQVPRRDDRIDHPCPIEHDETERESIFILHSVRYC